MKRDHNFRRLYGSAVLAIVLIFGTACGQITTGGTPTQTPGSESPTAAAPTAPSSSSPAATAPAPGAPAASPAASPAATLSQNPVTRVYQQASPSVVTVTSTIVNNDPQVAARGGGQLQQGTGSGFVIDRQGHIITNDHVVQDASKLEVTLSASQTVPARLVGRDPWFDLAVIQVDVDASSLNPLTLGDSDQVQVGETAIAIGNPFGLEGTVTTGVISARRATVAEPQGGGVLIDALQTDAAINPGNSGGPLLNAQGEVIGINTLARLGVNGGTAGINFAIPINAAKRIVPTLIQSGAYQHPYLGVGTVPITASIATTLSLPVTSGLIVQTVEPGSGAAQAGLRAAGPPQQIRSREVGSGGDVIVAVDNQNVSQSADLLTYLEKSKRPGDTVALTVIRGGQRETVNVQVGQRPPPATTPTR